jgi:hypothetical protein
MIKKWFWEWFLAKQRGVEANRCADKLANMGSAGSTELVLYDYPPSEVALVAFDDFRCVSLPRLISV